jgi:hypothetical protein
MDPFGLTFASGWASGINAYLTVLILGLAGRFVGVEGIPEGFQRTDVLIAMGVLTAFELVADAIPYVDSVWDGVSTVIRPVAGAVIGAMIGGADADLGTMALAAVGGVTALLSHLSKAGIRLAINTSPEPVTNVGASVTGNTAAMGVVILALVAPVAAAAVAGVLLLVAGGVAMLLVSRIKKGWRRLRLWWTRRSGDRSPGR